MINKINQWRSTTTELERKSWTVLVLGSRVREIHRGNMVATDRFFRKDLSVNMVIIINKTRFWVILLWKKVPTKFFILVFKRIFFYEGWFILVVVYLIRLVEPSPKIFINLLWTYEKLYLKLKENHIGSAVTEILC